MKCEVYMGYSQTLEFRVQGYFAHKGAPPLGPYRRPMPTALKENFSANLHFDKEMIVSILLMNLLSGSVSPDRLCNVLLFSDGK